MWTANGSNEHPPLTPQWQPARQQGPQSYSPEELNVRITGLSLKEDTKRQRRHQPASTLTAARDTQGREPHHATLDFWPWNCEIKNERSWTGMCYTAKEHWHGRTHSLPSTKMHRGETWQAQRFRYSDKTHSRGGQQLGNQYCGRWASQSRSCVAARRRDSTARLLKMLQPPGAADALMCPRRTGLSPSMLATDRYLFSKILIWPRIQQTSIY